MKLKSMDEVDLPQGSVALEEKLFPVYGREHSQNSLQMLKHYALYYNFGNMNRNRQISILRDP